MAASDRGAGMADHHNPVRWYDTYRGYHLGVRGLCGTYRIRRSDGTWGESEPTIMDGGDLVVGRAGREPGGVDVVLRVGYCVDLRREIDYLIETGKLPPLENGEAGGPAARE